MDAEDSVAASRVEAALRDFLTYGILIAEVEAGERRLRLLESPRPRERDGMKEQFLVAVVSKSGNLVGAFTAGVGSACWQVRGYLARSLDEVYDIGPVPRAEPFTTASMLALVAEMVAYDYAFPPELAYRQIIAVVGPGEEESAARARAQWDKPKAERRPWWRFW